MSPFYEIMEFFSENNELTAFCRPIVEPALNITIDNRVFFTPGLPGSGAVLSLILNILQGKSKKSSESISDQLFSVKVFVFVRSFSYPLLFWGRSWGLQPSKYLMAFSNL